MGAEAAAAPRKGWRRWIGGGVGIAVVVLTFVFVLPRIADYRAVWDVVQDLTWPQIAALVVATVLNLLTYAPPWQAALPGLGYRQGSVLTLASTASTYVAPGGAAVGMAASYAMLRGWGFRRPPIALAVTLTGIWNQFAMLGFPVVALALLTLAERAKRAAPDCRADRPRRVRGCGRGFAAGLAKAGWTLAVGNLTARLASFGLRLIRRKPVTWTGDVVRPVQEQRDPPASAALVRAHARHARRPADRLRSDARLAARHRCVRGRGQPDRGVRGLVDRSPARLAPGHPGRCRDRRGRTDHRARRLRRRPTPRWSPPCSSTACSRSSRPSCSDSSQGRPGVGTSRA